jgi:hypothetical protein
MPLVNNRVKRNIKFFLFLEDFDVTLLCVFLSEFNTIKDLLYTLVGCSILIS